MPPHQLRWWTWTGARDGNSIEKENEIFFIFVCVCAVNGMVLKKRVVYACRFAMMITPRSTRRNTPSRVTDTRTHSRPSPRGSRARTAPGTRIRVAQCTVGFATTNGRGSGHQPPRTPQGAIAKLANSTRSSTAAARHDETLHQPVESHGWTGGMDTTSCAEFNNMAP